MKTEESSMKNRKIVSLLLTGAMTAALLAIPAQAEAAPPSSTIRVGSYKGNSLEVRSEERRVGKEC